MAQRFVQALENGDCAAVRSAVVPDSTSLDSSECTDGEGAGLDAAAVSYGAETIDGDAATVPITYRGNPRNLMLARQTDGSWLVDMDATYAQASSAQFSSRAASPILSESATRETGQAAGPMPVVHSVEHPLTTVL
ncbi:hypothetical protein [Pseudoclavibacter sp. 13-3]|uniref:hypothetical protein n=1 Tax=Pseudoclavibacter sp. 13-3 TaxID=2901228 RepID=UPI001E329D49|nr:hypothetical protein [Pseudoclavibacter sp. 13-3]MCD7102003.1 hypothetical protein [Pseudoclavibacter sp. 13-3]